MCEIRYYSDPINDDFANTHIEKKPVTENFKYYSKNPLIFIRKFIIYRCLLTPVTWIYSKIIRRISYKNKKCMKGYKNKACFIYGNHTAFVSDAFNPAYLTFPSKANVVVNSDATSIKGFKWLLMDLGAIPIPENIHLMPKFNDALAHFVKRKHWIIIYPEAHIWPYYNKIRPFKSVSFRYPVKYDAPVFTFTTTYSKRKHSKKPKITVFIDGPFFPDKSLPQKQAINKLRDEAYNAMCERAERYSTYEYKYRYVYRPKEQDGEQTEDTAEKNED